MEIIEVIRGLGLGGAETLLALRIGDRSRAALSNERTVVINTAGTATFYEAAIAQAAELTTLRSSSILQGVVATFRDAGRRTASSVIVIHSPAAGIGYKAYRRLHKKSFTLIEVVHNTEYRWPYPLLARLLNHTVDLALPVSTQAAESNVGRSFRQRRVVLGGVDRHSMRAWIKANPLAYEEFRSKLSLDSGHRLICNIGNLHPRKNQQAIIRAAARPECEDLHFVIVGEGPERRDLEKLSSELGTQDRVHLIGRQPDAWKWASVADLVVHPSIHEGLPVVLMEAVALGTPVLATRFGGISDIITTSTNIQVCDSGAPDTLATAIAARLQSVPRITSAFPDRAATPTFWDIPRFTQEFYEAVHSLFEPTLPSSE